MKNVIKSKPFNDAQQLVLQIVNERYSEDDLKELRQLLKDFNSRKMQQHLDKTIDEKGYADADFKTMLTGHLRKSR